MKEKTNLETLKDNYFTFDILTEKQTDLIVHETCEAILKDIDICYASTTESQQVKDNIISKIKKGLK